MSSRSSPGGVRTSTTTPQQQKEEDEWLLVCRCEKAKAVYTLLSCLRNVGAFAVAGNNSGTGAGGISSSTLDSSMLTQSTTSNRRQQKAGIQPVAVFCYSNNLTFHVMGKSKQIQASVNLPASMFSEYNLLHHQQQESNNEKTDDWHSEGEFCINLPTVLQCLSLLGSLERMKLTLSYNLTQEVFQLELTDDAGVLSTASLSGLQPPEDDDMTSLALAMRSSSIHARVIFQSECLRDVLVELDTVGGAKVGSVSLNATSLDIAVVGDLSECLVSIPCKGDHVVSMECPPEASPHSFPLHSLLGSFRGLEIAHETCITVSKNGMMAIQHQVIDTVVGNGTPSFVDFIMCCLDETDDSSTVTPPPSETATRHSPSTYHHPPPPTVDKFSQSVATATSLLDDHSRVRGSSSTTVWHHGSDHDTTTDEDEPPDMSSAAPLFGSVVRSKTTGHKNEGPTMRRRQRRRMQASSSNERRHHRSTRDNRGTSGTTSDHDSDNDEDAEMQELDVSARRQTATTTAYNEGRDRGNTSSPELVYGRQE